MVFASLGLARYLVSHIHPGVSMVAVRAHEGLLGWDAGYYRDIAVRGYAVLPRGALRFFPLVPLLARWLHDVTRLSAGTALLVLVNALAFLAAVLLHRLAVIETGDHALAERAVWILCLAPPAYVLVMGYAESALLVASLVAFLALRSGQWWVAAVAGYLAGLTRPLGVLLAAPALIEVLRHRDRHRGRVTAPAQAAMVAAVVAPVAGAATYLAWVGSRFGDFLLPLRVQQSGNLRGGWADPFATVIDDLRGLAHGHVGTALHVPWLAVFAVLAVVALFRWPSSYGALAVLVIAAALTSSNLDSTERYALSAFPLVLAAAGLLAGPRRERAALGLLGAGLVGYSLLAFLNALVP
ncbi:MAG TPA: mannosyltransferase family protein [Acidimicrobiales bacterium]|nr:mannosyltransferase family protein [Acidimicrobiales bacterium]